ncbi:MAG: DUF6503 family protein [Nonlabens sp.]|uniref:DUF6503 family protein n=1 Tax=Nonlabens sp. TaxID=1888209 RepID=UPI003219891F
MKKIIITLAFTVAFTACKESDKIAETKANTETEKVETVEKPSANTFTRSIENAHQKVTFLKNDAVSYDFKVSFGDNTLFDGKITQKTDGTMIRMDDKDNGVIIFDGNKVYANSADMASNPMTRFHIFTWTYFFAMPYKLNDPGTIWTDEEMLSFANTKYPTSKLTFKEGIGDTSEDWYIVYKDPKTNVLDGVAYIVSFGKELEEAEAAPHFAKYNDLTVVDGVPFATNWTFHNWNKEDGFTDQIGEAQLSNIEFITPSEYTFYRPANALEVPMVK